MKKIISTLVLLAALAIAVHASGGGLSVTAKWQPAPNPAWGTKIYIGTESGVYTHAEDAGVNTTEYEIDDLQPGTTYYMAATHYNVRGVESDKSTEASWTFDPVGPIETNPLPELDKEIRGYKVEMVITPLPSE